MGNHGNEFLALLGLSSLLERRWNRLHVKARILSKAYFVHFQSWQVLFYCLKQETWFQHSFSYLTPGDCKKSGHSWRDLIFILDIWHINISTIIPAYRLAFKTPVQPDLWQPYTTYLLGLLTFSFILYHLINDLLLNYVDILCMILSTIEISLGDANPPIIRYKIMKTSWG